LKKLVSFVNLGCPKNEVDSEVMQSLLLKQGYTLTDQINQAQIFILNSCAFIQPAKEESIQEIIELVKLKGKNKKLVVAGCLAQRYAKNLWEKIPEIDGLLGINQLSHIGTACDEVLKNKRYFKPFTPAKQESWIKTKRLKQKSPYAYVKIADGCNNNCTYCVIPKIRGKHRSKPMELILKEVKELVSYGIREINLIAQDTTLYGVDLYGKKSLTKLLGKLSEIPQLKWLRLLYAHPAHLEDELIKEIASNDKICKYIDLPLQHISDRILYQMNRQVTSKEINSLIDKLRKNIPNLSLRTSFMVGFPGEGRKDFTGLLEFVEKTKFDKLGAFAYSREEGTKAYHLSNQLPSETKLERLDELMLTQQQICFEENQKKIGSTFEVLIEAKEDGYFVGRSQAEAPEVDGVILVTGNNCRIGEFAKVGIVDYYNYDLIGKSISKR
jgi:ribosomal protein S12 methylthiotransferase